ncbi:Ni/Fe hydrogenase subunit alpha [bacterium]|nr:Ni/Fe hydrogenase subunit alpha [bacterium]
MSETKTASIASKDKIIKVDYLARVEGEGSLYVKVKGGKVKNVQFKIFEPPRFFEAFLRGRLYKEAPDITARICGICPIAYQMSSSQAMENAFGVKVSPGIRDLRRLIYCGEWIESHVLHVYMLHGPDFLGYESAIHMAKDHGDLVQKALRMKKLGNEIMEVVGGRAIHPINVGVGGFYRAPSKSELQALVDELQWCREAAIETVRLVAGFNFPEFDMDYEYVALSHPDEYAITEGRLISNRGLNIDVSEYEQFFEESHETHSHALHSAIKGRGAYFVGPLARFNLNFNQLHDEEKKLAEEVKCVPPINNPFKGIVVRSLETLYAVNESLRLIESYEPPEPSMIAITPKAGRGQGCTEAPRGICWHRYTLDDKGLIQDAKIVPPTSQNQKQIEKDLHQYVSQYIHLPKDQLTWQCEQAVRNYDPCISCATHFLKLEIDREE